MHLLLIRHGESVGNAEGRLQGHLNSPLNDAGRALARALGCRLQAEGWEVAALYSSDLRRAGETAALLGDRLNVPVVLDPRLREYDAGVLTGLSIPEIEQHHPHLAHAMRHSPEWVQIPGAEGPDAFVDRLAAAVDNMRARHDDGEVLALVAHGASLGVIIAGLIGLNVRTRPQPFRLDNASLSIVEFRPRGPCVTRLNDTCHLRERGMNVGD